MYTRCTYCGSIYKVDATVLRQAAGQVRCGVCEGTFDALRLLSEAFPDEPAAAVRTSAAPAISDLFAEQPLRASRNDAHALNAEAEPARAEPAELEALADELEGLVEQLEARAVDDELRMPLVEEDWAEDDDDNYGYDSDDPDDPGGPGDDPRMHFVDVPESTEDALDAWVDAEPHGEDWWTPEEASTPLQGSLIATDEGASDADDLDDEAAEDPSRDGDGDALPEPPYLRPEEALAAWDRERRPRLALWISVTVIMVLAAALQWVHASRQELVLHPTLGPRLVEVYRLLGVDLHPDWDPELLRVERTEMVSHPSIPGALYLSGVLSNEGGYPIPMPTLRLRMDNRWGDVLAARDFSPDQYLRSPRAADTRLAAGERIALGIEVVDPDPEAVGFRIQVCLPADGGLRCR